MDAKTRAIERAAFERAEAHEPRLVLAGRDPLAKYLCLIRAFMQAGMPDKALKAAENMVIGLGPRYAAAPDLAGAMLTMELSVAMANWTPGDGPWPGLAELAEG